MQISPLRLGFGIVLGLVFYFILPDVISLLENYRIWLGVIGFVVGYFFTHKILQGFN